MQQLPQPLSLESFQIAKLKSKKEKTAVFKIYYFSFMKNIGKMIGDIVQYTIFKETSLLRKKLTNIKLFWWQWFGILYVPKCYQQITIILENLLHLRSIKNFIQRFRKAFGKGTHLLELSSDGNDRASRIRNWNILLKNRRSWLSICKNGQSLICECTTALYLGDKWSCSITF